MKKAVRIAQIKAGAYGDIAALFGLPMNTQPQESVGPESLTSAGQKMDDLRQANYVQMGFDANKKLDQAGSSNGNEPGLTRS